MPILKLFRYFVLILFVLKFNYASAQETPYLERLVTLNANNQNISEVLKKISAQTSVVFSYSNTFNDKLEANIICKNKPLRLVLSEIFKTLNCTYKIKGKYIIITGNNKSTIPTSQIRGYLYNIYDSLIISQASVYIKESKRSSVTNDFGFFEINFSNKSKDVRLSIAKEIFFDTTLIFNNQLKQTVTIYLYPKERPKQHPEKRDTVILNPVEPLKDTESTGSQNSENKIKLFVKKFRKRNPNFRNISDTLFSNVSLSLLPFVSTNRLLGINTTNKFSLNILSGYSKSVDVAEIGGLLNIDNGNVKYLQIGGLGNVVFGNVTGVQIAGLSNINSGISKGVQVAGIINISKSNITGLQIGGITNLSSKKLDGVQIAGIYNQLKTIKGVQLAGVVNNADTVKGIQITGILNKTTYLKGMQLGFINVADTCSGIPIGFFSYVNKGYHKLEIATDDVGFGTISFGTGVDKLYNVFILGLNYVKPEILTYGYGLGSSYKLHKKWKISLSLSTQQIQFTNTGSMSLNNNLSKLNISAEYIIYPKVLIGLGPTVSVINADTNNNLVFNDVVSNAVYNKTNNGINTKMWVGAKLYLKIF